MRDEIRDVAGREGELMSDPATISEEVARNYKPPNEDDIITCQFF
jgi:hypothetical protein